MSEAGDLPHSPKEIAKFGVQERVEKPLPIFTQLKASPTATEVISEGMRVIRDAPKSLVPNSEGKLATLEYTNTDIDQRLEGMQTLIASVLQKEPQDEESTTSLVHQAESIYGRVATPNDSNRSYLAQIYLGTNHIDKTIAVTEQVTSWEEGQFLHQKIIEKLLADGDMNRAEAFARAKAQGPRSGHLLAMVADAQLRAGDLVNADKTLADVMQPVDEALSFRIPSYEGALRRLDSYGNDHPQSEQVRDAIAQRVAIVLEKMEHDEDLYFADEIPQKRIYLKQYREGQMYLLHCANILANIGSIERAEAIGRSLTEGRDQEFAITLAEAYERRGDIDKAIEVMRPAADLFRAEFIEFLLKGGRIDEAREFARGSQWDIKDVAVAIAKAGDRDAAVQILHIIHSLPRHETDDLSFDEAIITVLAGTIEDAVTQINRLPIESAYQARELTSIMVPLYEKVAA